ncbi:MAG: carbamoyltransferase HypF [Sedimentisphaeraceae bacterium JB056]
MQRRLIKIAGAVQGVGFRPFVYNLANQLDICGYIANTTEGVLIEAQSSPETIESFTESVINRSPRLASPQLVSSKLIPIVEDDDTFVIKCSMHTSERRMSITPDSSVCDDCLKEMLDPMDRRYHYPFINCTNCGPRYTIAFDIPYDRSNTTMYKFKMCPDCQREYDDPDDRRFHAQPNACPVCGPKVWLTDETGKLTQCDDPVDEAIKLLEQSKILAIKGLGGFHLAVRADDTEAVERLRSRKYRKAKAFALMAKNIEAASQFAMINPCAEKLLNGIERPIVLCPKKDNDSICEPVAPKSHYWGIMMPYTPLHTLLMAGNYPALVMTSGNNTNEAIETDNDSAVIKLRGIADNFLFHNRDIYTYCDDSVAAVVNNHPMIIRRARGYAPRPIAVKRQSNVDIIAVGSDLKNCITLLKDNQAYTSQHIGDLENPSTHESMRQTIDKLSALTFAHPKVVVCDMHPAMFSTRIANSMKMPVIKIQHHHAHIAAVLGEHQLEGSVIGLAMDGAGYGTDDTIWGCEFLLASKKEFKRLAHLESILMPGGDMAARQSWRMAVSYLLRSFGYKQGTQYALALPFGIDPGDIEVVIEMLKKDINCTPSSGLGRLFDAVSSLIGVCQRNEYEAQAAIDLEYMANKEIGDAYDFISSKENNELLTISAKYVIAEIIADMERNIETSIISAKFHNAVINMLEKTSCQLAESHNCNIIALAGGVFQNRFILEKLIYRLKDKGLDVYYNERLPVNDGSISFGQSIIADAIYAQQNQPS